MREEWGDDEGIAAAAAAPRGGWLAGFRAARAALDAFAPDFVVIWGDDQYENFREDCIPPFCVFVHRTSSTRQPLQGASAARWGQPRTSGTADRAPAPGAVRGQQGRRRPHLADALVGSGFDVACSYKMHHNARARPRLHAHARLPGLRPPGFPYPIIPFHVNCYGQDMRIPTRRGGDGVRAADGGA